MTIPFLYIISFMLAEPVQGITITAELVVAIGAIITAILSFINSKAAEKRSAKRDDLNAKKDEVELLREEVARLQVRVSELISDNDAWRKKYESLYTYVLLLRKIMIDSKLEVPDMPELQVTEPTRLYKREDSK